MKIHMLGILGSGMSALSKIYKDLGYNVEGSDYKYKTFILDILKENKIEVKKISIGNYKDKDLVIVGHNFINHPHISYLKKHNIKYLEYHKALAELVKNYYSIAISGSNGKSSVTKMVECVLNEVSECSFLVGSGEAKASNNSNYFVFEACEYKRHFLEYKPDLILINNIDYDHVDYYKNKKDYKKAFLEFIDNSKDKVVINGDYLDIDKYIVFGIKNKRMFNARNINLDEGIRYDLYYKDVFIKEIKLDLYGLHMVYNSLACISVCMSLGVDINIILSGLKKFNRVKRRFMITIINGDVYIDDYAHHPSKIKASIEACKSKYKDKKIVAFYRPDRVTRLDYFYKKIEKELLKVDEAYIVPFNTSNKENKLAIKRFIKDTSIKCVDKNVYKRVSEYNNVVYLMMSSKDISEVKKKILEYKVI